MYYHVSYGSYLLGGKTWNHLFQVLEEWNVILPGDSVRFSLLHPTPYEILRILDVATEKTKRYTLER